MREYPVSQCCNYLLCSPSTQSVAVMRLFGIIPRNEASTVEVPQNPGSRSDGSAPSDKNSVHVQVGWWAVDSMESWVLSVIALSSTIEPSVCCVVDAHRTQFLEQNRQLRSGSMLNSQAQTVATQEFLPTNLPTENGSYSPLQRLGSTQACLILAGFRAIRERQTLYCYDRHRSLRGNHERRIHYGR